MEICKKCAGCCKNYPFIKLSKNEINLLELLPGLHTGMLINSRGKTYEEYFMPFKENGDCIFLNENNGNYSCDVYIARPEICKNYPKNPIQQEVCDSNREKSFSLIKQNI